MNLSPVNFSIKRKKVVFGPEKSNFHGTLNVTEIFKTSNSVPVSLGFTLSAPLLSFPAT